MYNKTPTRRGGDDRLPFYISPSVTTCCIVIVLWHCTLAPVMTQPARGLRCTCLEAVLEEWSTECLSLEGHSCGDEWPDAFDSQSNNNPCPIVSQSVQWLIVQRWIIAHRSHSIYARSQVLQFSMRRIANETQSLDHQQQLQGGS